jgi:anti-sigma-K factor RskA
MKQEDLEFQISQYADGSLPFEQRAVVEEAIRADASAQKALRDYQKLDLEFAGLRTLPAVRWDRLAKHLSDVIDADRQATERPAVAGRIFPIFASWKMRSAVAAVVVFAIGGTLWMKGHHAASPTAMIHPTDSTAIVIGPQAEVGTGPASEEIKIGPSRALAQHMDSWRYADGVVTHGPSKVTITAGLTPVSHTDSHLH